VMAKFLSCFFGSGSRPRSDWRAEVGVRRHLAVSKSKKKALGQVVVPVRVEAADEDQRHRLLSRNERFRMNLSTSR
jgi:hypothetical protein